MHLVVGRAAAHGVELGEHLDLRGREADLLLRLAQRRREQRLVAGIGLAAGQRELAAVQAAVGAHDQHQTQPACRVAEDRDEHGCDPPLLAHGADSGPLSSSYRVQTRSKPTDSRIGREVSWACTTSAGVPRRTASSQRARIRAR